MEKPIQTVGINGNINSIVITNEEDSTIQFAAVELQKYIKRITGKQLNIVYRDTPNSFYLKKENNPDIKWDGYKIETNKQGIHITANLSRGILYGVYSLLESKGCSFVYPDPNEEIIPTVENLSFNYDSKIYNPIIEHRGAVPTMLTENNTEMGYRFFDWMAKNRLNYVIVCEERFSDVDGPGHAIQWNKLSKRFLPELQKRGFYISMSEHCTHIFFPRDLFDSHPEWFALINGRRQRNGQICYSNKKAVELLANNMIKYLKKHPEFSTIGTWPLDGGNYCTCDGCKNKETIFKATTLIAQKIKSECPNITVEHLAYHKESWMPPTDTDINENMSVLWCPTSSTAMDSLANQWVEKSKKAQGVYQLEYYLGDHYRMRSHVLLRPYYTAQNVEYCKSMNFRGIIPIVITIDNWYKYGFNFWMFGKASWDDFQGVDKELNLYYQNYYGKYAENAQNIFKLLFTQIHPEPYKETLSIKNYDEIKPNLEASKNALIQLNDLIPTIQDKLIKKRFERLKVYLEYFQLHRALIVERSQDALDKLTDYAKSHSEFNEVLIYPEYTIYTFKDKSKYNAIK